MTACIGRQCIGMNGHFFFVIMSYFLFRSVFFLFFVIACSFVISMLGAKEKKAKLHFHSIDEPPFFNVCVPVMRINMLTKCKLGVLTFAV